MAMRADSMVEDVKFGLLTPSEEDFVDVLRQLDSEVLRDLIDEVIRVLPTTLQTAKEYTKKEELGVHATKRKKKLKGVSVSSTVDEEEKEGRYDGAPTRRPLKASVSLEDISSPQAHEATAAGGADDRKVVMARPSEVNISHHSRQKSRKSTRLPYDKIINHHRLKARKGLSKATCVVCGKPFKGFRRPGLECIKCGNFIHSKCAAACKPCEIEAEIDA